MFRINLTTNKITKFHFDSLNANCISSDIVSSIKEYELGKLYITTADGLNIVASGAATIILTATAPDYTFVVQLNQLGGGLTQAATTPGVVPVNTTAALALQGITVTNASYTSVEINYAPISGADLKDPIGLQSTHTEYINQGDGDSTALIVTLRYLLDGRSVSATGPANPEAISTL